MVSSTNLGLEISGKDLRIAVIRGLFRRLRLLRLDEITGFTEVTDICDLLPIASKAGIPLVKDLGSGVLVDLSNFGLKEVSGAPAASKRATPSTAPAEKLPAIIHLPSG